MITQSQNSFMQSQIMMMTLSATVRRNKIYRDTTREAEKKTIRESIASELISLQHQYLQPVSESKHMDNIVYLANIISEKHKNLLVNGRFRIGGAQKALNLYLKYLWCLGKIQPPPHFPIDAIMLEKIPEYRGTTWTKIDSIDVYGSIVKTAKSIANGQTLAQWELNEYNQATSTQTLQRNRRGNTKESIWG